jgi:hypothetical protein
MPLICGSDKAKYFSAKGLTRLPQNSVVGQIICMQARQPSRKFFGWEWHSPKMHSQMRSPLYDGKPTPRSQIRLLTQADILLIYINHATCHSVDFVRL